MKNTAKLKVIFHDDRVKLVRISSDCSTEILISKIEKWEYRPDVRQVIIVE